MNTPDFSTFDQQVAFKKLELLFRQSRASSVLNVVIACLLVAVIWNEISRNYAIFWLTGMVVFAALRVALSVSFFQRVHNQESVQKWQKLYLASLILIAGLWGFGGAVMLSMLEPSRQGIIYFFLMGMGGGFLVAHSVYRIHIVTFMLVLFLPSIVFGLVAGEWATKLLSVANFIFMLAGINATEILIKMLHNNFLLTQQINDAKLAAEKLANIDSLTNLNNRRAFLSLSKQQLHLCKRMNVPATLIMADVDDFKYINDNYGHDVGDKALIYIANMILANLRESDICARLGGEEFVVLLSDSDTKNAIHYAERLRKNIEENPLILGGTTLSLSVSMGVASNSEDIEQLLRFADKAMYQAKKQGKNQVVEQSA